MGGGNNDYLEGNDDGQEGSTDQAGIMQEMTNVNTQLKHLNMS